MAAARRRAWEANDDDDDDTNYEAPSAIAVKRRQAVAPSAAAAAAQTFGDARNPSTYEQMVHDHVMASRKTEKSMALELLRDLQTVREVTFAEYRTCDIPSHSRIVRKDAVSLTESSCGCTGQPIFPSTLPAVQTMEDMMALRSQWRTLNREVQVDEAQASVAQKCNERDAWVRYLLVIVNVVRPHVIRAYRDMRTSLVSGARLPNSVEDVDFDQDGEERKQSTPAAAAAAADPTDAFREPTPYELAQAIGQPNLHRYEEMLRTFDEDVRMRTEVENLKADRTTPLICFQHSHIGHLVPVHGFRGYDVCYICPLFHAQEIKRVEPQSHIRPEDIPVNAQARAAASHGWSGNMFG